MSDHTEELSPLALIEERVQDRAKTMALDMNGADGPAAIRALIDDEINRWNDEFKRGQRPYELSDASFVADRAYRNLVGYGPLGPLLDDDDVWEIMINAPDAVLL